MASQEISASSASGSGPNSQANSQANSQSEVTASGSLSDQAPGDFVAEVALIRALAEQLALPLSAEQEQVVTQNWMALAAIAQPLMQLDLPEDIEPAPRFEP